MDYTAFGKKDSIIAAGVYLKILRSTFAERIPVVVSVNTIEDSFNFTPTRVDDLADSAVQPHCGLSQKEGSESGG